MQRPAFIPTLHTHALSTGPNIDQAADRIATSAGDLPTLGDTERTALPTGPTADELGLFRVRARLLAERPALQQATGYQPQLLQSAYTLDQALIRLGQAGVQVAGSAQAGVFVLAATAADRNRQIAQAVDTLKQGATPADASELGIVFDVSDIVQQDALDRAQSARDRQKAKAQPLEDRLAHANDLLQRQALMHQLMAQGGTADQ